MLSKIEPVESLRGLARSKNLNYVVKTVTKSQVNDFLASGWIVQKQNKTSVRLTKKKSHSDLLEDRVWSLMYRMGFAHLSDKGGAIILLTPKDPNSPTNQIDVVAVDHELAIAIECKSSESSEKPAKRPQFQEELSKFSDLRDRFANAINQDFANGQKRQVALAMFMANIDLSENDRKRAEEKRVIIFDDKDLSYYEALVGHVGQAARYQFLADILAERTISGLQIRVPAVRTKMGGFNCYTFSVSPEYLLKIAYVSHRSKGKASDVNAYQRMLNKSRMSSIREYISKGGIFPTNIVVNIDQSKYIRFEKSAQEGNQENGTLGYLELRPAYKSAWIIDGQHRLFAYSGHPDASKSLLSILAFEAMPPSKQAELFIDINAKQKSVKQSLLQELYAELHWNAEDPTVRVRAIVSKAIQTLDADPSSAFYNRILASDDSKDAIRCISLNSMFSALKLDLFVSREKFGFEYRPLWAGDNDATLKRTVFILKQWFGVIEDNAKSWWKIGSAEGGGLAMNDGVTVCINVLRNVLQHLEGSGCKLSKVENSDLFDRLKEYATALGMYLGDMSLEERRRFRELRGAQGQRTATMRCQQAMHELIPAFDPPGLKDFIELEAAQTNSKTQVIVEQVEELLQSIVPEELKAQIGEDDSEWWYTGVPKTIRKKVMDRYEEDEGIKGSKEKYFDLIDYKQIAIQNWEIFENMLAYGKQGSKDKRTQWINEFIEARKNALSVSYSIPVEQVAKLQEYQQWLESKSGNTPAQGGI